MSLQSPLLQPEDEVDALDQRTTAGGTTPARASPTLRRVILASSPGYTPPAVRPIIPKTLLVRAASSSPAGGIGSASPSRSPPTTRHIYPSGSPIFPLVVGELSSPSERPRGGSTATSTAGLNVHRTANAGVVGIPGRPIYLSSTPPPSSFAELRLAQMNASPKHIASMQHHSIAVRARRAGSTAAHPRGSDDDSDSDDLGSTPPPAHHRSISLSSSGSTPLTRTITLTTISASEAPSAKDELRSIWRLGWPVAMALLFRVAMSVTDVAVLGHKDTDFLAASAAALIWINVTSAFLYRAYGSALNTLCSQAYGAGNFTLVGYWLQQGLLFSSLSSLVVALLWWFTEDVLRAIDIDPKIAALGGTFARWSILWLVPQIWMECLQRYFQAQHVIFPSLVLNAIFVLINAGLNLLLIFGLPSGWWPAFLGRALHSDGWAGLGFIGSPIATAISRWSMVLVFWAWTCAWKRYHAKTWANGWALNRREALHPQRVRQYLLQQCLPSAIGVCLEEFNLQIVAIFATHLGAPQIATHNATLEIFFFLTSFMFGLITAVQVRIGLYLGKGRPVAAKQVAVIGLKLALGIGSVVGVTLVLLRQDIGKIYSSDPQIWALAEKISVLVGAAYVLLSFFYVAMGVLNGQGRPLVVAVSFLVGCWVVCLPLAYVFAFTLHQGLIGIWYSLVAGYSVVTVIVAWKSYTSDWAKCAEDAKERSESKKMKAAADAAAATTTTDGDAASGGAPTHRRRSKQRRSSAGHRVRSQSLNSDAHPVVAVDSSSIHRAATQVRDVRGEDDLSEGEEDATDFSTSEEEEEAWNAEEVAYREKMLNQQRQAAAAAAAAAPPVASPLVDTDPLTPVVDDLANITDADPMAAVAQPLATVAAHAFDQ